MSKRKFTEAEIIAAIHQVDGGRTGIEVGREVGVSKHTIYAWKAKSGGLSVNDARRLRQ
jgi:putative transposase